MIKVRTVKPKLLDQVRHATRARHLSYRTYQAYVHWIKKDSILGERYGQFNRASNCGVEEVDRIYSSLSTTLYISQS